MILFHLSLVVTGIYLFFGVYILKTNYRSTMNKLFAVISVLLAMFSYGTAMQLIASSESIARHWHAFASVGWIAVPPFIMLFLLYLVQPHNWKLHQKWLLISFVPVVVFLFKSISSGLLYSDFIKSDFGWISQRYEFSWWSIAYFSYMILIVLIGLFFVARWGIRAKNQATKWQAGVIFITGSIAFIIITITNIVNPSFHFLRIPMMGHVFIAIWYMGIWVAINQFKMLTLTPSLAAPEILGVMLDPVLLIDNSHKVITANKAASTFFALSKKEILGKTLLELFPHEPLFQPGILSSLLMKHPLENHEILYNSKDGEIVYLSLSAAEVKETGAFKTGDVIIFKDISTQKKAEEDLRQMATIDPLTNIPNRILLYDRAQLAFARSRRYNQYAGLLLLDIDHFKNINDNLGHKIGDLLLKQVAGRLLQCARESDTVARLGGDVFVLLLNDLNQPNESAIVAKRIADTFTKPFIINGHQIHVTASTGISVYPADSDNFETLLKNADMALYQSKHEGTGRSSFFDHDLPVPLVEKTQLKNRLQLALEKNEFVLWYQPLWDVMKGKLCGMEALIRWNHPQLGMVSPMKFIPVAEESGLIKPIGDWALREACRQNAIWQKAGYSKFPIAVNCSAGQLDRGDLAGTVKSILEETRLDPQYLHIELTESAAMLDLNVSNQVLNALNNLGIAIVIDDFGSGYSSLTRLKSLPIYALKIDRFFIQNIVDDERDMAIVKAIVSMAHSLGLQVIAEGVETQTQLKVLRELQWEDATSLQCDTVQGFLFCKPIPASECEDMFLTNKDTITSEQDDEKSEKPEYVESYDTAASMQKPK